jgi:hypothetical protein
MNKGEYQRLCYLNDEVLMGVGNNSVGVAISWLHIIREHPDHLANYDDIFESNFMFFSYLKLMKRTLRNIASLIFVLLKSIIKHNDREWSIKLKELTKCHVLFISHLLNSSQYNNIEDIYFSNLPQRLAFEGYCSLTVKLNHSGVSSSHYSIINDGNSSMLVLPDISGVVSELKNLMELWKESLKLIKKAYFEKSSIKRKILLRASIEALSSASMHPMRLAKQMESIIEHTNPKVLIATHEGYAWERMAFYAARKANPNIFCTGYIHAPLFELQHSVRRLLASIYNPDQIFTSGKVQVTQLEKSNDLKDIPIEFLGSNKINYTNSTMSNNTDIFFKDINKRTCLVIPEGIPSEINLLFKFSLECAQKFPEIHFIWRLHPLFSFYKLTAHNNMYSSLPNNIVLSENSIEQDMKICQGALYRGSSAIIQAVMAGLKPIYLQCNNEMDIDPLYELKYWKEKVDSTYDLQQVMKHSMGYDSQFRKAVEYCRTFYTPFDHKPIVNLLERLGNNA